MPPPQGIVASPAWDMELPPFTFAMHPHWSIRGWRLLFRTEWGTCAPQRFLLRYANDVQELVYVSGARLARHDVFGDCLVHDVHAHLASEIFIKE